MVESLSLLAVPRVFGLVSCTIPRVSDCTFPPPYRLSSSIAMRHVLHLHSVTQCAILEDFGLFLVLADKTLLAYHIEALVPAQYSSSLMSTNPQRLNAGSSKDIQFFTVGTMYNRTLVIYARKRGVNILFPLCDPNLRYNMSE